MVEAEIGDAIPRCRIIAFHRHLETNLGPVAELPTRSEQLRLDEQGTGCDSFSCIPPLHSRTVAHLNGFELVRSSSYGRSRADGAGGCMKARGDTNRIEPPPAGYELGAVWILRGIRPVLLPRQSAGCLTPHPRVHGVLLLTLHGRSPFQLLPPPALGTPIEPVQFPRGFPRLSGRFLPRTRVGPAGPPWQAFSTRRSAQGCILKQPMHWTDTYERCADGAGRRFRFCDPCRSAPTDASGNQTHFFVRFQRLAHIGFHEGR